MSLSAPNSAHPSLHIGIAGLGRMGTYHAERIGLRDDCRVTAVWDQSASVRERWSGRGSRLHREWAGFLADPDIELVLIATPPATHCELAIAALQAGKHVILETPMCLNLAEADLLVSTASRLQRMLSVAHTRRWDDDFRTLQNVLADGNVGRPDFYRLIVWQYNPFRISASATSVRSEWRDDRATGGGTLWEFGVHYIDQLLQMTGTLPTSVHAQFTAAEGQPQVDDGFLALMKFADGSTAHVEFNRRALAPLHTGWVVSAAKGGYANFTQYTATDAGEVVDVPLTPVPTDGDQFYAGIVNHLRHGRPNPVPPEQGRAVISLVDVLLRSAATGHEVRP